MKTAAELINAEIDAEGPIPFARFMELALYAPEGGYYERTLDQVGRAGDFYTSVSVGPFFGELLAFQFSAWLRPLVEAGLPVQIVESGAHTGQLAADILHALSTHAADLLPRMEYVVVEPSAARRAAQQRTLAHFGCVRWAESLSPSRSLSGVIFSNELLDAMPVHPFAWDRHQHCWRERAVTRGEAGKFVWTILAQPSISPPNLPEALLDVLPDGYVVELCPAAAAWWRKAAESLQAGVLMTIDYGGTLEELLNPGRSAGTLRAYSRHAVTADVLAQPGTQDITAHVNFSDIRQTGESAGLKTEAFTTQAQFLTAVARQMWSATGTWPASQVRQFQTLTHPQHLGRPFSVLIQSQQ